MCGGMILGKRNVASPRLSCRTTDMPAAIISVCIAGGVSELVKHVVKGQRATMSSALGRRTSLNFKVLLGPRRRHRRNGHRLETCAHTKSPIPPTTCWGAWRGLRRWNCILCPSPVHRQSQMSPSWAPALAGYLIELDHCKSCPSSSDSLWRPETTVTRFRHARSTDWRQRRR
jgi:hypothetical protein